MLVYLMSGQWLVTFKTSQCDGLSQQFAGQDLIDILKKIRQLGSPSARSHTHTSHPEHLVQVPDSLLGESLF
jgi:hypothetical protein